MKNLNIINNFIFFNLFIFFVLTTKTEALIITETENISIGAIVAGSTVITPTSNNNGSHPISYISPIIYFSGHTFPFAQIILLQSGKLLAQTTASSSGLFSFSINSNPSLSSTFTIKVIDKNGGESIVIPYTLVVKDRYITMVDNIFIPPTLSIDNKLSKNKVLIYGYSNPNSHVHVNFVDSNSKIKSFFVKTNSDGLYSLSILKTAFKNDNYIVYAKDSKQKITSFRIRIFLSNKANNIIKPRLVSEKGDCNLDNKFDQIDLSIFNFWYNKSKYQSCLDMNSDGVFNIRDYSIMYYKMKNIR